jgi:hypothetical protein
MALTASLRYSPTRCDIRWTPRHPLHRIAASHRRGVGVERQAFVRTAFSSRVLTTNEEERAGRARFDSPEPIYLAGTDGARWPFWSADSRTLAFFVQGELKRIDATGGPIESIARAPSGQGGAWSRDGTNVFSPDRNGPLYQVAATGGRATPITTLDRSRDEASHQWPAFLPDGRPSISAARLARAPRAFVGDRIVQPPLAGPRRQRRSAVRGLPPLTRAQMLLAQPFDPGARLTGEPIVVQSHVYTAEGSGPTCFSTSNTGVLVYHEARLFRHQLAWFNRSGRELDLPIEAGSYFSPVLSSDGTRIALERHDARTWQLAVWQFDLARRVFSRVTSDPAITMGALWSSDGRELAFATNHDTTHAIYKVDARRRDPQLRSNRRGNVTPTDWSSIAPPSITRASRTPERRGGADARAQPWPHLHSTSSTSGRPGSLRRELLPTAPTNPARMDLLQPFLRPALWWRSPMTAGKSRPGSATAVVLSRAIGV